MKNNRLLGLLCGIIFIAINFYTKGIAMGEKREPIALNLLGKIVFESEREEKETLGVYLLEYGRVSRLASGGNPKFYKDSSHIIYFHGREGYILLNLESNQQEKISFPKEFASPDFDISPDGKKIAFTSSKVQYSRWKVPQTNLFVANIDGTEIKQLTDTREYAGHPRWSPDGSHILFTCAENPVDQTDGGIFSIKSDGTDFRKILGGISRYGVEASWSPDGRKIVFNYCFERKGADDIYIINADGSNLTRVTKSPYNDRTPIFSPDGTKILFVSHRHPDPLLKGAELYVINIDGTNERQVTPPKKIRAYGRWRYATDSNPDWKE